MYCKKGGVEHITRVPKAIQVIKLQHHRGLPIRYDLMAAIGCQRNGTKLGDNLTN